jgi:putative methionine-R-sulfoxide reductase with GAF domain
MIGFGFMDNLVMITAGEAIDSTFGVAFGLSTMAAAGLGQCCSDVVGVTSGGIVDATISKLRVPQHGLGPNQLDLRVCRMWSTAGAAIGVLAGCLLGMSCLLFIDTDRAERARKARELQSIFASIMEDGANNFNAERTTLFMLDKDKKELWSQVATGTTEIIKVPANKGIAGACVTSREMINISDVYKDSRFNQSIDESTGFVTKSILAMPIKNAEGEVLGVIEVCNKKNPDGSPGEFIASDEKVLRMVASHVSSFISIVNG